MLTTQQTQQDACLKTQEVLGKPPDESAGCKQQATVFDHFQGGVGVRHWRAVVKPFGYVNGTRAYLMVHKGCLPVS